ncbi:type B 50S ribosomal protein L31 [Aliivibrio kagoshimensis]|uniref:type B 50S ribosomal protein L31 n=1 Tax=Aliivibrio kagoshimensis TaxID=2910230 RepID=UPI003D0C806F
MKKSIHPKYQTVVFHDTSVDEYFMVGSTLTTDRTITWKDGKEYPYMTLDTSSASHPFYTGQQRVASTEGRVADFSRRFGSMIGKK